MIKIVILMVGMPGSGKSRWVKQYCKKIAVESVVHSTDSFHYVDGKYQFDREKVAEYHDKNFLCFCDSLLAKVPVIIVDNTNTRAFDRKRYVVTAQKAGYLVLIKSMPLITPEESFARNVHGVPLETIERMHANLLTDQRPSGIYR